MGHFLFGISLDLCQSSSLIIAPNETQFSPWCRYNGPLAGLHGKLHGAGVACDEPINSSPRKFQVVAQIVPPGQTETYLNPNTICSLPFQNETFCLHGFLVLNTRVNKGYKKA